MLNYKALLKSEGFDDIGLLKEYDNSMDDGEVQKNIESILDEFSAGKITQDQMKTRLKEFASWFKNDIGKYGNNLTGKLGLNP